jgi:hypothetical protein
VITACPKKEKQLFVLVAHEPTIDRVLQWAERPVGMPETPRLVPSTMRLTVTRTLIRGTRYAIK